MIFHVKVFLCAVAGSITGGLAAGVGTVGFIETFVKSRADYSSIFPIFGGMVAGPVGGIFGGIIGLQWAIKNIK